MIIGIGNNYTEKGKELIKKHFIKKKFLYVNCDELINKVGFDSNEKEHLDKCLKKYLSISNDIVIDFTNLYDYKDYVDLCDYIIDISHTHLINEIGVNRTENRIITYSPEQKKYHFVVNFNNVNWERDLDNNIDFNFNNNIKVSVVVPIYNSALYLVKCIDSIVHQSYKNLEIILVDDGSTDNSNIIINQYKKVDNRIIGCHKKNGGLSSARNYGLKKATGEYIVFIDSDDYIDLCMIELMLKRILEKKTDMCECGIFVHNKDQSIISNYDFLTIDKMIEKDDLINAYADGTIIIAVWNKMFKCSAIKGKKFRVDVFKEDSDYILRMCQNGLSITQIAIPLYHYIKKESGSLTGNKFNSRFFNLSDWAEEKSKELLETNQNIQDASDKILFNSYVHILKYYLRDFNKGILEENEYKKEIIEIYNKLVKLIINTNDVSKYLNFGNVIQILNLYISKGIISKDVIYKQKISCIGIIWNSLKNEYKEEILNRINAIGEINKTIKVDFKDNYYSFIKDIYIENKEAEGIPFIKYATLNNQFNDNEILIVYMDIDVSLYEYTNNIKGFQFETLAVLKRSIRNDYKNKISKYAFDNIYHMTMNNNEYELTDAVIKKYLGDINEYK